MRFITSVVVCLAIIASPTLGEDKPVAPSAVGTSLSLVEMFKARNPKTLAVLAADFPQDHRALLEHLQVIERTGQSQMVLLNASFDALSTIRRKYASKMVFAPPDALADLLGKLVDFYDDVLEREGPALCGKFAQDGSGVLFQLAKSENYVERLDTQSAAYFDTVVKAIEMPEDYGDPVKEDYPLMLAAMMKLGAPQSYVASIAMGNGADPNLCPALATMARTAAALETPEALRMRATLAQNLAGY